MLTYAGPHPIERRIYELLISYLNTPYLWGGEDLEGTDCSGLVFGVLKACGFQVPRLTAGGYYEQFFTSGMDKLPWRGGAGAWPTCAFWGVGSAFKHVAIAFPATKELGQAIHAGVRITKWSHVTSPRSLGYEWSRVRCMPLILV